MSASTASASTPSVPSATKARKEVKFQFGTIKHLRDVVAIVCLDLMKGKDLTVAKQQSTAYELFHGDEVNGIMGEAGKFINGIGVYAKMKTTEGGGVDLWIEEHTRAGPRTVISEAIHQQNGKSLVRGDNITQNLICRTFESKSDLYKGEQILTHARAARAECRKMDGLMRDAVKARMLTFENGEYSFPSGKTKEDFDSWMLKQMFNYVKNFGASGAVDDGNTEIAPVIAPPNGLLGEEDKEDLLDNDNDPLAITNTGEDLLAAAGVNDDRWDNVISSRSQRIRADIILEILQSDDTTSRLNLREDEADANRISICSIIMQNNTLSAVDIMKLVIEKFGIKPNNDDDTEAGEARHLMSPLTLAGNDDDEDKEPHEGYLPKGWAVFQLLGPFAEKLIRVDFYDTVDPNNKKRSSRTTARLEDSAAKSVKRDASFDNDLSTHGGGTRGAGAVNRKYLDHQTHLDRHLTNQQYEAEIMKMQLILTSKGGTRDSLTTVYSTLINAKQFEQAAAIMTQLMAEIHSITDIQNQVLAMQNKRLENDAAVGGVIGAELGGAMAVGEGEK